VKPCFTNPAATEYGKRFNIADEFNADAARQSWAEMLAFLERVMR
jgi:dienelactone hydrolase